MKELVVYSLIGIAAAIWTISVIALPFFATLYFMSNI